MKLCKKCGEKLEKDAGFCSKCGAKQVSDAPKTADDKALDSKDTRKTKKKQILDTGISLRQFFHRIMKEEYTKETEENIKSFLEAKKMLELLPVAKNTRKKLYELSQKWEQVKAKADADEISINKVGKLKKSIDADMDVELDKFEKAVEDLREKEERKKEGKKRFNDFNAKKQRIYEKLKDASPNDGSCDDKDCGYNNCLTLAMKIAAGKDSLDSCSYIDDDDDDDDD
jgi:ArsR family metal-binding transcriptional regulator